MSDVLIRNVSDTLKNKLKDRAKKNHRSVSKEIYAILEEAFLDVVNDKETPVPYKGKFKISDSFIESAKKEGRK